MKYYYKYIIVVFSLFAMACDGGEKKLPANIISKDKMIDVMTEVELTQALIKLKSSMRDTINEQQLYDEVFEQQNITQDDFNESLRYYCEDPKLLMNMYNKVIENLTKKESEQEAR